MSRVPRTKARPEGRTRKAAPEAVFQAAPGSRLLAGESPDEIRNWLTARYGDYVSYEPQVSSTTWPLFAIPLLLLAVVALILLRRLGKRHSDEEKA